MKHMASKILAFGAAALLGVALAAGLVRDARDRAMHEAALEAQELAALERVGAPAPELFWMRSLAEWPFVCASETCKLEKRR